MKIIVTGSIAYDYLMSFPGKFTELLLPDQLERISLSFLVDTMDKRRGGCAPNIAYTLALLGERPLLMATAGEDFGEYREWLNAAGVDTSHVRQVAGKFTASFFCSTDQNNNQIASFYTGAMADAGALSFRGFKDCGLAIISPNDPAAMMQYAEECRTLGIRHIFDPGQQCARMSGEELREGIIGATIVICNDYEFELLKEKTGLGEADILRASETLIVTRGEHGSSRDHGGRADRRAGRHAAPDRRSDGRRRRVPRRPDEGHGAGAVLRRVRAAGQCRGDLRARAPRWAEPLVFLGGLPRAIPAALRCAESQVASAFGRTGQSG